MRICRANDESSHLMILAFFCVKQMFLFANMFFSKVLLIVYVDDFKAAGPVAAVEQTWKDLKEIDMDPPTEADRFLGCNHRRVVRKDENGNKVVEMHYDMCDFMQSCCDRYLELAGKSGAKTTIFNARNKKPTRAGASGRERARAGASGGD